MGSKSFHQNWILTLAAITALSTGCAKYDFSPIELENLENGSEVDVTDPSLTPLVSTQMKMGSSSASFTQDSLSKNITTVMFQAVTGTGDYINNLTTASIALKESGINVANFKMTSNPQAYRQTVDIAFLIDVTCSMKPTIASAKTKVVDFIRKSRAQGYHTRMCLSTFGDYTVSKCDRFYDNDPGNAATEMQVEELISAVNSLNAGCGAADPGGRDLDENPLQSILDVESAPWASGSQRFAILLTDAGFLYSPTNPGALGANAPVYTRVLSSIARSGINIFAATPSEAGYNSTFNGSPSIVSASNGEHFLYSDLVSGVITFDNILNRILDRVQTTYAVEYTVDDIPGLDASLPLSSRNISVSLKSAASTDTVRIVGVSSNLPNGRASYKKKWMLSSSKRINSKSLIVKVNEVQILSGYSLNAVGELEFSSAPAAGSKIEVIYSYSDLVDALQTSPVVLSADEDLSNIAVFLNGIKVGSAAVSFEKDLSGNYLMSLKAGVTDESDPFKIREHGGLLVQIFRLAK